MTQDVRRHLKQRQPEPVEGRRLARREEDADFLGEIPDLWNGEAYRCGPEDCGEHADDAAPYGTATDHFVICIDDCRADAHWRTAFSQADGLRAAHVVWIAEQRGQDMAKPPMLAHRRFHSPLRIA